MPCYSTSVQSLWVILLLYCIPGLTLFQASVFHVFPFNVIFHSIACRSLQCLQYLLGYCLPYCIPCLAPFHALLVHVFPFSIPFFPMAYRSLQSLLEEGTTHLHMAFTGPKRCSTLLVCGTTGSAGAGCGKSSLARLIAREAQGPLYHAHVDMVDCTYLRSKLLYGVQWGGGNGVGGGERCAGVSYRVKWGGGRDMCRGKLWNSVGRGRYAGVLWALM